MIPVATVSLHASASPLSPFQPAHWQQSWREAVRDPRELLRMLGLESLSGRISDEAAAQFPLRVPRGFVARMRSGDANDPLLRQVLPLDDEMRLVPGFEAFDAVGDAGARVGAGLLHKYRGRALLVATGSCAVNCRYCFRRHFPYAEQTAARAGWREAVEAIRADDSIEEVILSGGDPLSLATSKLAELTDALNGASHLKRLRIHTRLPVVLPDRVDAGLLEWLARLPWPVAIVLHANHANEFDGTVDAALSALRGTGAQLLNQAVLLRGVNDSVQALADLGERSFAAGVLPYYLHQLDQVAGVAHFQVPDQEAKSLHAGLAARVSGYLVPRLVREVAGDAGKRPL
ncbi:MAG: EF-P beta-lysylation protein EpmB [Pseudoxanthomonas sp.]